MTTSPTAPEIAELLRRLRSGGTDERERAATDLGRHAQETPAALVESLGRIGPDEAVPSLREALRHPDFYDHPRRLFFLSGLIDALEAIGPGADALPALHEMLEHEDRSEDWLCAAQVLGAIPGTDGRAITHLRGRLRDPDRKVRHLAAACLGCFGSAVEPVLIPLLRDEKPDARILGLIGLGRSGNAADPAVPDLIRLLDDADAEVRACAVDALMGLSCHDLPSLAKAAPALAAFIQTTTDDGLRFDAAETLGNLGRGAAPIAPSLIEMLGDANEKVRSEAAHVLGRIRRLRSPESEEHRAAAHALGGLGCAAASAVPDLIPLLEDEDRFVREQAVSALGSLGSAAAIPHLIDVMEKQGPGEGFCISGDAVEALRQLAPGRESIPPLLAILEHGEGIAIENAADLLAGIEGADAQAVPILAGRLADGPDLLHCVTRALGRFPSAIDAVLSPRLRDDDPKVRAYAALGVGEVDEVGSDVVAELIRLLEDPTPDVRNCAVLALGRLYRDGASDQRAAAAPRLTAMLRDEEFERMRSDVAETLATFVSDAPTIVPDLVELLRHAAVPVRSEAAYVLSRIGEPPAEAIPLLTLLLREDSCGARSHAAQALARCGEAAADAVPDLIPLLRSDEELRGTVAETLGKIGAAAAAAVPELVGLLRREDDYWVRKAAIKALGSLGPAAASAIPDLVDLLESNESQFRSGPPSGLEDVAALLKSLGWEDERATARSTSPPPGIEPHGGAPTGPP